MVWRIGVFYGSGIVVMVFCILYFVLGVDFRMIEKDGKRLFF